jgi:DNA-binding protein Fis
LLALITGPCHVPLLALVLSGTAAGALLTENNVTKVAESAGIERESLHRLLRRYGIRTDIFKRLGPLLH